MSVSIGIGLAFVAMLCWGFGDFLIQRSTRKIGDWETLFVITIFGVIILLPFVFGRINTLFSTQGSGIWILIASALVLTLASMLEFESFKKGKLAIVEPIIPFEIPTAFLLAFFVLHDKVSLGQTIFIILLIFGLCLVSFREKSISKKFFLEKGVFLAFTGAAFMGIADFFLGWGSRVTDPILANFVLNIIMATVSGVMIISRGQIRHAVTDIMANRGLLLTMSIADNVAWVAYAFAMSIVPIAVATGLSESSVIIAVMLGFFVNKERIQSHQKLGLILAIISAIVLAAITSAS